MLKIGLTGNIACGKSSISNILQDNGYYVIDADLISREIYEYEDVMERMKIYFPEAIINGTVDRKKLANIVFYDDTKLKTLNRIAHDKINAIIDMRIDLCKKMYGDDIVVIIDAALLFEAKFNSNMDKVVVVYCDEDEQLMRLMDRDSLSVQEALSRINSQMSQEEKISMADYVINNSYTIEKLYTEIEKLMKEINEWKNM